MSIYLEIAEAVLSKSKLPLSAREILEAAYRLQLVPAHLFGKTQHKTLHARLSEDLMKNKRTTIFARTGPGRFSLRSRIDTGGSLPSEYVAPLRAYQLKQFDVVCAERDDLQKLWSSHSHSNLFSDIASSFLRQIPLQDAESKPHLVHVRILVILHCSDRVLTLTALAGANLGRGRSMGLLGYLKGTDADLFSSDPWGIDNAARRTIAEQTTLTSQQNGELVECIAATSLRCLHMEHTKKDDSAVVILTSYECKFPDQMLSHIPAHRAPRWLRVPAEINDFATLEPVSNQLIRDHELLSAVMSSPSL